MQGDHPGVAAESDAANRVPLLQGPLIEPVQEKLEFGPPPSRRELFRNVAAAFVATALSLGAAEYYAREHAYTDQFMRSATPGLFYELKQPVDRARFNDRGQIGRAKRTDIFRVAVLGDSVAFGVGLDAAETIPAQLGDAIRAHGWAPQPQVEVMNAAVPGYDIMQIRSMYAQRVVHWFPDVVVYLFFVNDFVVSDFVTAGPGGDLLIVLPRFADNNRRRFNALSEWLLQHSSLAAWTYTAYALRRSVQSSNQLLRTDYAWGRDALRHMQDIALLENQTFVVAIAGPHGYDIPSAAECPRVNARLECWCTESLKQILRMCSELRVDCLDMHDVWRKTGEDYHLPGRENDPDHPNAAGARLFARELEARLRVVLEK